MGHLYHGYVSHNQRVSPYITSQNWLNAIASSSMAPRVSRSLEDAKWRDLILLGRIPSGGEATRMQKRSDAKDLGTRPVASSELLLGDWGPSSAMKHPRPKNDKTCPPCHVLFCFGREWILVLSPAFFIHMPVQSSNDAQVDLDGLDSMVNP